eukprot:symbB.v1.2.020776.t1/scaffold1767.1/size102399/1
MCPVSCVWNEDNTKILKLWFDPRNDVDALYHQFGVASQNIYDLQLAEVALRRCSGDYAERVLSLQNCLLKCEGLDENQKAFAGTIKEWGKDLFEPKQGGSYKVFQDRPLRDEILIYAAHDSRYMRVLYECYRSKLDSHPPQWSVWVSQQSQERSLWFRSVDYVRPSADAPPMSFFNALTATSLVYATIIRAAVPPCHRRSRTLKVAIRFVQEQVLLDSFRSVNVFESPDECLVSGDDVLAYLKAMRDHFGTKKVAWWDDYYSLENVTKKITGWNCTEMEVSYYDQLTSCENKQQHLEQIACEVHERTNESCTTMPACYEAKWSRYLGEAESANTTIQDLKYEYRAIKRILCLLDAFESEDMDTKLEECMNARYTAASVKSQCVDNHPSVKKPPYDIPAVCDTGVGVFGRAGSGVTAILHPDDKNFNETEYASKGIHASRCIASCCTIDFYSWTTHSNVFVPGDHIMLEDNKRITYGSVEDAKTACEGMGSVQCFGIYDANCDGASEESPVELVASPGLNLNEVKESSVGSCIYHMELGPGTTTTTTIAQQCTWQLEISKSDEGFDKVWKTLTLEHQRFDEQFRFSGCDNQELPEASVCIGQGVQNGVRILKNREGHGVASGSCCDHTTNKVLDSKRVSCDGYLDEYTKHTKKYLTSTKLLRGTTYPTMSEAREACLRKGTKCWGIYDDKCDSVKFLLVDSQFNITSKNMLESVQDSCIYEKLKA